MKFGTGVRDRRQVMTCDWEGLDWRDLHELREGLIVATACGRNDTERKAYGELLGRVNDLERAYWMEQARREEQAKHKGASDG